MEAFRTGVDTTRTGPDLPQHSDGTRRSRRPLRTTSAVPIPIARPTAIDNNAAAAEPTDGALPGDPAASGLAGQTTDEQIAEWQRLVERREAEWQRLVAHLEQLLDSSESRARQGAYHAASADTAAAPDSMTAHDAAGQPAAIADPWATAPVQVPSALSGDEPPRRGADPTTEGVSILGTAPGPVGEEAAWIWPQERTLAGRIRDWMSARRKSRP